MSASRSVWLSNRGMADWMASENAWFLAAADSVRVQVSKHEPNFMAVQRRRHFQACWPCTTHARLYRLCCNRSRFVQFRPSARSRNRD